MQDEEYGRTTGNEEPMNPNRVLIVDDDANLRKTLSDILDAKGYVAIVAGTGEAALDQIAEEPPAIVLIDLRLEDVSGLEVIEGIKERSPDTECIILTGHASLTSAIEAVNLGAYGYVLKPCDVEQLVLMIRRAIEQQETQKTLRATTQLLGATLEHTHVLVAYLDVQFNFVWVNRAYAEADEREASFFPGKNHFDLYPSVENEAIFQRVVETGEPYYVSAKPFGYAEHPERGVRYWDWSLAPIVGTGGSTSGLVLTLANVTERVRAEKESVRRVQDLTFLNRVGQTVTSLLNPEQILETVLEETALVLGTESCSIFLLDSESDELIFEAVVGPRSEELKGLRLPLGQGFAGWVARERQPLLIPDVRKDPRFYSGIDETTGFVTRSIIAIPLKVNEVVIGVLEAVNKTEGEFGRADVELLSSLAQWAVIAIENARLLERARAERDHSMKLMETFERRVADRTRELTALYEVTAIIGKYLDLDEMLKEVLGRALEAMRSDVGTIHLLADETDGKELYLIARQGIPPDIEACADAALAGDAMGGKVVAERRSLTVFDLRASVDLQMSCITRLGSRPIYAGAPIQVSGQALGVVGVIGEADEPFSVEEVALLTSIAEHTGMAVENARLRRHAERAAVLAERERLARELHDSVAQSLYSLILLAGAGRDTVKAGQQERVAQYLVRVEEIAHQALKEMRLLVYELRPAALERDGLAVALHHRLETVESRAGVQTRLLAEKDVALPAPIEEGLYYIAREALNNALKHAAATSVTVRIDVRDECVTLEIADDGVGFDAKAVEAGGGIGLSSMRERAERLGGSLEVISAPGTGTRVEVSVGVRKGSTEAV
jgi:signal transduction histidine kinase/ActR/RegA family two-component response regulator